MLKINEQDWLIVVMDLQDFCINVMKLDEPKINIHIWLIYLFSGKCTVSQYVLPLLWTIIIIIKIIIIIITHPTPTWSWYFRLNQFQENLCLLWSAVYIFKSGLICKLVPLLHRKHTIGQVRPIAKQTDQPTCIQSLIILLMKCHWGMREGDETIIIHHMIFSQFWNYLLKQRKGAIL